jgi:hypothetical protein
MSPPEIWGPPIWTLFHTLSEKINPHLYTQVINSMFGIIIRICKYLPCPECSKDASNFLAKIKIHEYKTKNDFKNMIYLFHNYVNAKKRKPLFNSANINKYSNLNLGVVISKFIENYNTKGNMKLLTESFQRSLVIKDFIKWFKIYSRAFQPIIINNYQIQPTQPIKKQLQTVIEEQPVIKQLSVIEEQHVIKQLSVIEETDIQELSDTEEQFVIEC